MSSWPSEAAGLSCFYWFHWRSVLRGNSPVNQVLVNSSTLFSICWPTLCSLCEKTKALHSILLLLFFLSSGFLYSPGHLLLHRPTQKAALLQLKASWPFAFLFFILISELWCSPECVKSRLKFIWWLKRRQSGFSVCLTSMCFWFKTQPLVCVTVRILVFSALI